MNRIEIDDRLRDALEGLRQAAIRYKRALATATFGLNRKAGLSILEKGPRYFLAYCALVRIMKSQQEFFSADSCVLIVRVPRQWLLEDMEAVVDVAFYAAPQSTAVFRPFYHSPRNKKGNWDFTVQQQLAAPKVLVLINEGVEVHPEVELAADATVTLEPMSDDLLLALTSLRNCGPLGDDQKRFLRTQNAGFLDSIFRRGRPASEVVRRLEKMTSARIEKTKALPIETFGKVGAWGLQLQKDVDAWRSGELSWADIDKGVLLYGPPGTGKTSFAVSLAALCGIPIVATSLAIWQSGGHLGDLLKAMYRDFDEARSSTPSILLIDEIDAVGDRRKFSGENAQYCSEVVNALLECLDGAMDREGVIVIAASNFPDRLDAALLRPGRLEKHLELANPRSSERLQILRYYLPDIEMSRLEKAAIRLKGRTGADIEYLTRRAKARARQQNRTVSPDDLDAVLPPHVQLSSDDDFRICLHEAAHTVLAKLFNVGEVEWVEVSNPDVIDDDLEDAHGRTMLKRPHRMLTTESNFRNEIAMKLGGMAVEELYAKGRSTTSGGARTSDLAEATSLAIEIATRYGLGKTLCVFADRVVDPADPNILMRNPGLADEVQSILDTEFERAKHSVEEHRDAIFSIADGLSTKRRLSGSDLAQLLESVKPVSGRYESPPISHLQS